MTDLTKPQALMLAALAQATEGGRPAAPRQLARLRWPDSEGWNRRTRKFGTNDPGAMGGTMPMKAATVLWRLADKRLAERVGSSYDSLANLWMPTEAGLRWLSDNPDHQ
jgi:hypothetical protein